MPTDYHALLLDLSGVLYDGETPIEGAREAVAEARRRGLLLRFVTNTASSDRQSIIDKLRRMHIDIDADELFTAPMAAHAYIQQQGLRPFCLIHRAIRSEFDDIDQHDPNCVLLGDARDDLNYVSLNKAFQLCKQGAPLIGIGMNKYFKEEQGLMLDAGAFIHAIEWAADTDALIMGKPGREFFQQVVTSTGLPAAQCLMVGDDLSGDVEGAIDAGLQACLVRSGKFQPQDEDRLPDTASVIDSIAVLFASENRSAF